MEIKSILNKYKKVSDNEVTTWYKAVRVEDFPEDSGACVKYKDLQVAVFHFKRKNEWYACQNLCPHKMEMVLSRGLLGDENGVSKVACPLHKMTFSLESGENLNSDLPDIAVYPVQILDGWVTIGF